MQDYFDIQSQADHERVSVRRMLDINTAPYFAEQVDLLLGKKPPRVVVDLAPLDMIDSSGVAALVKLYKGIRAYGGKMEVVGARDQPLAIFKITRMDKVFGIA